jgi:uncharacterized protein (DUF2147 family)
MKKWLLLTFLFCLSASIQAQDQIIGQWHNAEKSSIVRVYKATNGKYNGKIAWLEEDFNADGTTPRVDELNPDEGRQNTPLLNLIILKGLEYNEAEKQWQNGTIYDPENGKTYECYCELNTDGSLYFKGYVLGITWLGRSTTWTRP